MTPRLVLVLVAVTAAVAGCASESSSNHFSAEAITGLEFERVDDPLFLPEGDASSLVAGASREGGSAVLAGSIVNGETGAVQPLAVESSDGVEWTEAQVPAGGSGGYISGVAWLLDDQLLAVGGVFDSDGNETVAIWRRDAEGAWSEPTTPRSLAAGGVVRLSDVAAGQAGILASGTVEGEPALFTSQDGDEWAYADIDAEVDSIEAVAAGKTFAAVALGADRPSSALVLSSDDGTTFANQPLSDPGLAAMSDLAPHGDGFVAVGSHRSNRSLGWDPAVWTSADGSEWRPSALDVDTTTITNYGTPGDELAVGPGIVAASASGGLLWTSEDAETFRASAADLPASGRLIVAGGYLTLFSEGRIYGLDGAEFVERSPELLARPQHTSQISGVTHGPQGYVAVGSVVDRAEDGSSSTTGTIWRSSDGRSWEKVSNDDEHRDNKSFDSVTSFAGGYVAAAEGFGEDDNRIHLYVSPDGTEWQPIDSPELTPSEGGIRDPESLAPYGDGFILTGRDFVGDGERLRLGPLVLISDDGSTLRRSNPEPPADGEMATFGACASTDAITVVGGLKSDELMGTVWSSGDGATWEEADPVADADTFDACAISPEGHIVAIGDTSEGLLALGDDNADAVVIDVRFGAAFNRATLPSGEHGASGQFAHDLSFVGEMPVVVGAADDDPGRGAVVWAAPDGDERWVRLSGGSLGGPGEQSASGIATDGKDVVVVGEATNGGAVWISPVSPD